jgi:hypothetical protein
MSNVINLRPPATAVEVTPAQITPAQFGPHRIRVTDGAGAVEGWFPTDGPAAREACEDMVLSWAVHGWLPPGWSAVVLPVVEDEPSVLDLLAVTS